MNLLLNRDQAHAAFFSLVPLRIGSGVTFILHAELELDAEEQALLKTYKLTKAPLVVSDPVVDLIQSFRPAAVLGIVTLFLFAFFEAYWSGLFWGLMVTLVMTGVYFKTLREQIIVSDLLAGGRKFRCDSIVALIQKEAYLEYISSFLRQVLESAKHWDDREAIAIPPLKKEDAKAAVLAMLK